jgi:hypothetical protein
METCVIKGTTLSFGKHDIFTDFNRENINVIGYHDLSHDYELFRPWEILVGTMRNNSGHLIRLSKVPETKLYNRTHKLDAPAGICDILPVYIGYNWPRLPGTRYVLAAVCNPFHYGVWIRDLNVRESRTAWVYINFPSQPKIYKHSHPAPVIRFQLDYDKFAIKALIYRTVTRTRSKLLDSDVSDFVVNQHHLSIERELVDEFNLSPKLQEVGVNIEESLAHSVCFITQYA